MEVYIVMSGCSYDEAPVNVFRSRKIAEKWVEENKSKLYNPSIEQWTVFNRYKNIETYQGQDAY